MASTESQVGFQCESVKKNMGILVKGVFHNLNVCLTSVENSGTALWIYLDVSYLLYVLDH